MKVLAINGSPRKKGNTELLLREAMKVLEEHGIDTELIKIGGKKIKPCTACMKCKKEKDGQCHISNKLLNEILVKMTKADGLLIGSPVYFSDITRRSHTFLRQY